MRHDKTLTLREAAWELGVPASTLRRWANRNQVPFLKTLGGQRRFTHQQLRQIRKQSLTTTEAARELGVSGTTLRRWAIRGLVPSTTTPDGRRRFSWAQVGEIREIMSQPEVLPPQQKAA